MAVVTEGPPAGIIRHYMERMLSGLIDSFDHPKNIGWPDNADRFYQTVSEIPIIADEIDTMILEFALGLPEDHEYLLYCFSIGIDSVSRLHILSIIGRPKQ